MTGSPRRSTLASSSQNRWHGRLTLGVDIGIASTVVLAPLFMGGRGPVGRFVFVSCVAITAILWCARQCVSEKAAWRKSGAEVLLLAGLGLLVLQLVPLPSSILTILSPHISELLPLWTPNADMTFQLGTWSQVSLHPSATQSGLATYIAYATLFLIAFQRFASRHDVEQLLRLIAVATCVMAVVGLAQFLFSNGKFLWVFEHVSRDTKSVVRGPFQNQNHFAHLLALGIGPLLWWLASLRVRPHERHKRGSRNHSHRSTLQSQILWIALGTVTFAALLTFSRGGVIATLVAAVLSVAIFSWKQMLSRRAISVVALSACLMVVSLSIHGYEPLARRLGTLRDSTSINEVAPARWALWSAHFKAIPDFWLLGSGVGTHRDIYPTYLEKHFDVQFTHGESGYFPLILETGLLGIGLFLVGVCCVFRWALVPLLRSTDHTTVACAAAIVPGLTVSVVQSLGDFVWYIPACMTTTVLLLAAACHLFHDVKARDRSTRSDDISTESNSRSVPRLAWIGTSIACLLAFTFVTGTLLGPAIAAPSWYKYQRLVRTTSVATWEPPKSEDLTTLAAHLQATVTANPNDAYAHSRLAGLYLQLFDVKQQSSQNPMPLSQIRDAALASKFASKQALEDWLELAVGENRQLFKPALHHVRRSVQLCPLQGESYTWLARVAFLEGPSADRKGQYIQQALQVRPFHSRVQFIAGQELMLAGNAEAAIAHWKKAFHGEREVRDELVRELTAYIPVDNLLARLSPDPLGLEALLYHYQGVADEDSARAVAKYYTRYLVSQLREDRDTDRLTALKRLSQLYEYLDARDEAIRVTQEATRLAPSDFDLKLQLGRLLVVAGRFVEAQPELQWCARRQPDNVGIRELLATANREAVLQQADVSTTRASGRQFRQ